MKEEVIKTEELMYNEVHGEEGIDALMKIEDKVLIETEVSCPVPQKNTNQHESELSEIEDTAIKTPSHLGELIWLKSEPIDGAWDKEPEEDDQMSFGYFEDHGKEQKKSYLLAEGYIQGNSKFTCFYCGNESFCLKKLRAHIKTTHTGPKRISEQSKIYEAIIIYSCRYCNYRTNDNSLYSNHLRKHLAELPVTKKVNCSKEFKNHSHEFKIKHRFRCPYCSFMTSDNDIIRYHMCSCHENERPYHYLRERSIMKEDKVELDKRQTIYHPCPECEYRASRSGTLKRHIMAKHTNERPYHCMICEYQATQNETLRRHILAKHTNEKPHHCPRCAYKAVQMGTLKYHVKSKHNLPH